MIDNDGIERPDIADEHQRKLVIGKRQLVFDENYNFYPHSKIFRMWSAFFRFIAVTIFNPITAVKYGIRTYGHKNKKSLKHKPCIITINHCFVFDDVCLCSNVFPERKIYFTTLENNIRRHTVGFFLRSLCGMPIPVSSISGMKRFNSDVEYILKVKKLPVLYNPEQAMWPYYREIRPFKKGAFHMAVKCDVPILPVLLTFKRKKKRNGKYKYKLSYTIGEPVEINKTLVTDRERADDLLKRTHDWYVATNKHWYATHKSGYGDHDEELMKAEKLAKKQAKKAKKKE